VEGASTQPSIRFSFSAAHATIACAPLRRLFPPSQLSAEINARIAALGFAWLVGEMELQEGEVQVAPDQVRRQKSIVHIKKCRYLESSGCVGLCVNMCKVSARQASVSSVSDGVSVPASQSTTSIMHQDIV